jgi:hypothetical protein
MSQITVDRLAVWENLVPLPPNAAAPAVRLIHSLRRRGPVWRAVKCCTFGGPLESRRIEEEAERWDGMS